LIQLIDWLIGQICHCCAADGGCRQAKEIEELQAEIKALKANNNQAAERARMIEGVKKVMNQLFFSLREQFEADEQVRSKQAPSSSPLPPQSQPCMLGIVRLDKSLFGWLLCLANGSTLVKLLWDRFCRPSRKSLPRC
jgi:hypothetical protein